MSRLFDRLNADEPALGAFAATTSEEVIDMLGFAGLDFVCIDMMVLPADWEKASTLARVMGAYNVTPMLRLSSYPWQEPPQVNPTVSADILRAIGNGYEVVMVSLSTAEQVAAALQLQKDNHRRPYLPSFEQAAHTAEGGPQESAIVLPLLESRRAIEELPEILALEDLQAVFLGMGDLSQVLGCKGEFEHPKLRRFIVETVEQAAKHDVAVFVNVYSGDYSPESVINSGQWLWDNNVRAIFVPYFTIIVNDWYNRTVGGLRDVLEPKSR